MTMISMRAVLSEFDLKISSGSFPWGRLSGHSVTHCYTTSVDLLKAEENTSKL